MSTYDVREGYDWADIGGGPFWQVLDEMGDTIARCDDQDQAQRIADALAFVDALFRVLDAKIAKMKGGTAG